MKNLKFLFLSIAVSIFTLVSCTNNDTIENETHLQSKSAKSSMQQLKKHLNIDGSLNEENNRANGILFDYGFSFKFPITLMFNTNKTVNYTDFNNLAKDLVTMNDSKFIDGIAFPFEVRVFDKTTKSVITKTIENEKEFETLNNQTWRNNITKTLSCNYNPVCVEYTNCWGEVSIWEFPNAWWAYCYGYSDDDFVDCNPGKCFDFNYPIYVINSCGYRIRINSDHQWENMLYFNHGVYEFVFPFDVTININQEIRTINSLTEYNNLLNNCDKNCACPTILNPVCVLDSDGNVIEFLNMCEAECAGYDPADIFPCNPKK